MQLYSLKGVGSSPTSRNLLSFLADRGVKEVNRHGKQKGRQSGIFQTGMQKKKKKDRQSGSTSEQT